MISEDFADLQYQLSRLAWLVCWNTPIVSFRAVHMIVKRIYG